MDFTLHRSEDLWVCRAYVVMIVADTPPMVETLVKTVCQMLANRYQWSYLIVSNVVLDSTLRFELSFKSRVSPLPHLSVIVEDICLDPKPRREEWNSPYTRGVPFSQKGRRFKDHPGILDEDIVISRPIPASSSISFHH